MVVGVIETVLLVLYCPPGTVCVCGPQKVGKCFKFWALANCLVPQNLLVSFQTAYVRIFNEVRY